MIIIIAKKTFDDMMSDHELDNVQCLGVVSLRKIYDRIRKQDYLYLQLNGKFQVFLDSEIFRHEQFLSAGQQTIFISFVS